jgi:HK97 family phage prohead protease
MSTVAEERPVLIRSVVPFEVKALNEKARTFEGLASTWDLDLGDDVIHKGAYKDTLAEWRKSSSQLPMFYGHNYRDIGSLIGHFADYKETDAGLWVKGELLDDPFGDAALKRLKAKILSGMSIGYQALKFDFEESDEARWGTIRNIFKAKLNEISLVPFPMNPGATVDLSTVKDLAREQLLQFKDAVEEALRGPGHGGAEADAPPLQPDDKKATAPAPSAAEDEEPDYDAFATLQLRRLALHPNARKEA